MRDFSQSLQGDAKEWFKHLHPKSISTWEEFSWTFLKFWGRRRPLEQILSEFYSLRRHEDEAISGFNKRFASFYYNMPKEFQPLENVDKIYYASAFFLTCPCFFWRENQPPCRRCLLIVWRLRKTLRCPRTCQIRIVVGPYK